VVRPQASARVPAHPVEQKRGETVRELVRAGVGPQPCVRPVHGRERNERSRAVVEIGTQLASFAALAEERADAFLVAAALREETVATLALEIAPLANEDGRHVELPGDDAQVAAQRCADPLDDRPVVGHFVERGMERLGALARDLPEKVGLRFDVRVEGALLDAERLCEIADRGAVVALLGEEPCGGAGQLGAAGGDTITLTIVRSVEEAGGTMAAVEIPGDEQAFLEYVQGGGQVEVDDWLPEDYRAKLIKFIEMHGNSELMGVLPEREWILRAPTLQRKLALTAKVQDEVGHAQLIYRVVEDLGKTREQCLADLVSGKSKFHNVFHYPTRTWGDVGVIAWLVDAAAIISQKALLKCSYAPYARIMKKICWEESFHILHGRDVILAMVTGTPAQFELVQEALDRWWGPLMQFHGNPIAADDDPMFLWRIKSQGNEDARQQFLDGYVPQILELGLTVPDPKLRKRGDGVWEYSEPDWDELKSVVTGHGPCTSERLAFRAHFIEQEQWVRDAVLAA
jgi:ring-1,2-phenylacetyl-CoA epoxidase subunit PaaA